MSSPSVHSPCRYSSYSLFSPFFSLHVSLRLLSLCFLLSLMFLLFVFSSLFFFAKLCLNLLYFRIFCEKHFFICSSFFVKLFLFYLLSCFPNFSYSIFFGRITTCSIPPRTYFLNFGNLMKKSHSFIVFRFFLKSLSEFL